MKAHIGGNQVIGLSNSSAGGMPERAARISGCEAACALNYGCPR